jgi:hypothetical protein
MKVLWTAILLITAYAQSNYDACLSACFSEVCGSNFVSNLTCLCNQTIYQSIQQCLSTECIEADFSAAQALQQQYCRCSPQSLLVTRQCLRLLALPPSRPVQRVYRQLCVLSNNKEWYDPNFTRGLTLQDVVNAIAFTVIGQTAILDALGFVCHWQVGPCPSATVTVSHSADIDGTIYSPQPFTFVISPDGWTIPLVYATVGVVVTDPYHTASIVDVPLIVY